MLSNVCTIRILVGQRQQALNKIGYNHLLYSIFIK